jgi:hypothetical protein
MDEQDVRVQAEALCVALVSGDIELATADFSAELRRNLGEVVALFPLPATAATVESIAHGGPAYVVTLELTGETETVQVQTRWKERDGKPTVIEASHLSRIELAPPPGEDDEAAEGAGEGADGATA